jgi:hypothetical protein
MSLATTPPEVRASRRLMANAWFLTWGIAALSLATASWEVRRFTDKHPDAVTNPAPPSHWQVYRQEKLMLKTRLRATV